jgi:threonine/homoserine/homoserine lactone efflux protein
MREVAGHLVPLAVVVAASPVPIIAVILMLLASDARGSSTGFLAGWILGIVGASTAFLLVADHHRLSSSAATKTAAWVELVLGLLLLLLAGRHWRNHRGHAAESGIPRWLVTVHQFTPGKATGLGIALSAANPKNLVVCVAAGAAIAGGGASGGENAYLVLLFTALATSSVALPVVAYAASRGRMTAALDSARRWLTAHHVAVTITVLLVIGIALVGSGLKALS